jgi:hypothetical protein
MLGLFLTSRPRNCLITLAFFLTLGCSGPKPGDIVLNDFESDADLDRLHWRCHVLYSLSPEHATRGSRSLRMELYPSEYPGLTPFLGVKDWRGFSAIGFDIFNPGEREVRLTLRIDDREKTPEYGDRYNEAIVLKPGPNRVVKVLADLKTSGSKRPLNLGRIYRFLMFVVRPQEKIVLYVDNIRLVK